jgi:excisionase family DNA binding protein
MNELLTVKEAADLLGTAERFIRRLIFERRIPYTKLGRHVRIAARDLDAFVRAGRIEAGKTPLPTRRGAEQWHTSRSAPATAG